MRLGILSDIHIDANRRHGDRVTPALIAAANARELDWFILAGDIAGNYRTTLDILGRLEREIDAGVLFVPGNHDIWNREHPDMSSWDIYHALQEFPGNLANGPRELGNGWRAVGDMGWYDFGFGGSGYSHREFERMEIAGRVWRDRLYASWGESTQDVHAFFMERLRAWLAAGDGRRTVMVTHVVPVVDFLVTFRRELWNYLNAFLGSPEYGQLAWEHKIPYAVCGHVHFRRDKTVRGTRFICNCLGYSGQWRKKNDPVAEVDDSLVTIDLDRNDA